MNRYFRFIRKTASSILMSLSEVLSLHYLHKTAITLVATLVGTTAVLGTAEAIDFNWIAGTGDWENDSNWSNGFGSMVPDEDAFAFVDNGGTAQVQTTDSVAGYVYIGNVNSGALDIFGGGQLESFYGNEIGRNAGSSGAVTVDGIGSSWQLAGPSASLDVGASGEGSLTITNGGEVLNADSFLSTSIGDNAGSSGTVTVDGTGSKLTNINASINVGNSGNGTLNILNGGSVSNTFGSVGRLSGATGTVTVDGAGSSWNNSNALGLGDWGNGTLNIINDGLVAVASGAATVELGRFGGSGTLNIGNGGAAGILNAAAVNGGPSTATLNFNHNESNYFFTNDSTSGGDTIRITGTTDVNFIGSGTTYISGNNTYTGSTNITSGVLVAANLSALGSNSAVTVHSSGELELEDNLTIGSLAGDGAIELGNYNLTTGGDNTSTDFSGVLSGIDGSLTKIGTGTLNLSGTNTYTGATTINEGTLAISSNSNLGDADGALIFDGGTLQATADLTLSNNRNILLKNGGGIIDTGEHDVTYSGRFQLSNGGLVKQGSGKLTLTSFMNYRGTTTIAEGTLELSYWSNGGNYINNGAITFTNGFSSGANLFENISGAGSLTKEGLGALGMLGNRTYTGNTYINNGRLIADGLNALGNNSAVAVNAAGSLELSSDLTIGSLTGAGSVNLSPFGPQTLTSGGNNTSTTFSGVLSGTGGGLTKIGTGSLSLTGINSYSGDTTINDGLVVVNGSIANSATTINTGGTLGGIGMMGSVTINGGTLAPGNSIGTLNVAGDVDFSGGGVYEVEVDAAGNSDLINATGTATLTNGTVLVRPENGNYNLSTDYTIVTAAGGLGDTTFDSISSNLAFLTPTLTYDANNVLLNLRRNSSDYASVANTANQKAVSSTLDTLALNNISSLDNLFNNLNILSDQGAQQAYDSLSGVQHTHSNLIALQSLNQFQGLLLDRLQSGSPTLANNGQIQLAYNDTGTMTDAGTSLIGEKPANNRGWWLRGTGSYADIDGTSNASGAHYKSAGTAAGRDIFVDDLLTVGLALGYNRTDASVSQGSLDVDSYQVALYGKRLFTDNYYVSGIAGVGYHDFESKRGITVGLSNSTARADYHAWTSNLAVEIGRLIEVSENTNLTPLAGLEYAHTNRTDFVEKDADEGNLNVRRDRQDSLKSVLGTRITHRWKTKRGYRIQPTAEMAWVHELMDNEAQIRAGFAATSLANFQVDGPELDRDRARLALGLDMQMTELTSIQLGYQGEWASSDQRHALSATLKMLW